MTATQLAPIQRALISVSDKTGIVDFAHTLFSQGIEILSTGGTAGLLKDNGITVVEVSDYTGVQEMMGGRVKTLHPKIHGGLLGRRGIDDADMEQHAIAPIDMVVVNLYPFAETITASDCDLATAIENIDIGGPAMVRAAAKNYAAVTVVTEIGDYSRVLEEMHANMGATHIATRLQLAAKAFAQTARYDAAVANYLNATESDGTQSPFPRIYTMQYCKTRDMRYGENPHQKAALYTESCESCAAEASVAKARQLQGKALSYNNVADTDAALECVKTLAEPACVIVKHANPCGVATAEDIRKAYEHAFSTDPTSAFGGIIAFNRTLDAQTAAAIIERQFVEVIIAPAIAEDALAIVATKKNVRLLACGDLPSTGQPALDYKQVNGGLLLQDRDRDTITTAELQVVTQKAPSAKQVKDLLFAWKVAKFVKSNAIVYCRDGMTIGIGAGQMSRVYSARIALLKAADAGLEVTGSVMASDAFFPFRDSIDSAAAAGVHAIIQPGGSIRDSEVIAAADEHGLTMVFTGMRHFRH